MTESVPIAPWDGGTLYDEYGNRVGSYCKETGRGMFAHTFFVDVRTCTIESVLYWDNDLLQPAAYETELSCGHTIFSVTEIEAGMHCQYCGARVVNEED